MELKSKLAIGVAVLLVGPCVTAVAGPTLNGAISLEDRVRHQRAIEDVYWRHRIWPKENPTPKPELSSVMSDAAIRAKVDDYLRKSKALETLWGQPVTAGQLQAELDRIVRATGDGASRAAVLRARGADP